MRQGNISTGVAQVTFAILSLLVILPALALPWIVLVIGEAIIRICYDGIPRCTLQRPSLRWKPRVSKVAQGTRARHERVVRHNDDLDRTL